MEFSIAEAAGLKTCEIMCNGDHIQDFTLLFIRSAVYPAFDLDNRSKETPR